MFEKLRYFSINFRSKSPISNGDIGANKPDLGGPNSGPGGGNAEEEAQRPHLTEEEIKVIYEKLLSKYQNGIVHIVPQK